VKVPVVGLLGRTGQRKELVRAVPPEEFGEEPWGPAVDALDGPIELALQLEAVSGGILVRGSMRASAVAGCARCLTPTRRTWEVDVVELHRAASDDDDAFEDPEDEDLDYRLIERDTQLDLDQMVRDALVVGQPVRVLCRPDCAGLCPICGADRNSEPCDHADEPVVDVRWQALKGLRLAPAGPSATQGLDPGGAPTDGPAAGASERE
jgi:uncharacterized protein